MNKSKNIFNKKEMKERRIALRKNMTSPEAALWNLLKTNNLMEENSGGNRVLEAL
jgi:very-short-patch-repair endonuclease